MYFIERETHDSAIQELLEFIGEDWLAPGALRSRKEEEHPLRLLFRLGWSTVENRSTNNEQYANLVNLALTISTLRNSNVYGLDLKLETLRDENADHYASFVHELLTAASYLSEHGIIAFIPETSERTPDLLVNGNIEVECKRKLPLSSKDRSRFDLYDLLTRKLVTELKGMAFVNGLTVTVHFLDQPKRSDVDEIVQQARRLVSSRSGTLQETRDGRCKFKLEIEEPESGGLVLPIHPAGVFDLISTQGTTSEINKGVIRMANVLTVAYRCTKPQDKLGSLKNTLKKAAGQFTATRPAIIEVEMDLGDVVGEKSIPGLQEMLQDFLRSNKRISAVNFVTTTLVRSDDRVNFVRSQAQLLNDSAKFPLPENRS